VIKCSLPLLTTSALLLIGGGGKVETCDQSLVERPYASTSPQQRPCGHKRKPNDTPNA